MPQPYDDPQSDYDPPRGPFPWRTLLLVVALCFTLGPLLAYGLLTLIGHVILGDMANGFGPGVGFGPVRAGRDGVARRRPTVEQHLAQTREAEPYLQAIHQYREDVGVWPMKMDALVPDYLPAVPRRWEYTWFGSGGFCLRNLNGLTVATSYTCSLSEGAGWRLSGGDWAAELPGAPEPEFRVRPADPVQRLKRFQAEMVRRIARDPEDWDHRYFRAYQLYQWGHWEEAAEACRECIWHHPIETENYLLLGLIEYRAGREEQGESTLREYAHARGDFVGYFLLAEYFFQTGRRDEGLETLRIAVHRPIPTRVPDRDNTTMQSLICMTSLRFLDNQDSETLHVFCNRTQERVSRSNYWNWGLYHLLRSALWVHEGRFTDAEQELETFTRMLKTSKITAYGHNIEDLADAIKRRDRSYWHTLDHTNSPSWYYYEIEIFYE